MALLKRANPGISINWRHPAADNLQFLAVTLNGGQMVDLVRKLKGTSNGSASTTQDLVIGRATVLGTPTTTDVEFAGYKTAAQGYMTVAALVRITSTANAANYILTDNVPGTSGVRLFTGTTNKFTFASSGASGLIAASAVVSGAVYFVAGSFHLGTVDNPRALVYRRLDGAGFEALSDTTNPGSPTPSGTITLGQKNGTSYWHGDIAWALQSYSYTSIEELIRWSRDPWSIFNRASSWAAYSSSSGANAFTQSVNATTTPNATIARQTGRIVTQNTTPNATIVRLAGKLVNANSTPNATIVRANAKIVGAQTTPNAAIVRSTLKPIAASSTPNAAIVRQTGKVVSIDTTPVGALTPTKQTLFHQTLSISTTPNASMSETFIAKSTPLPPHRGVLIIGKMTHRNE